MGQGAGVSPTNAGLVFRLTCVTYVAPAHLPSPPCARQLSQVEPLSAEVAAAAAEAAAAEGGESPDVQRSRQEGDLRRLRGLVDGLLARRAEAAAAAAAASEGRDGGGGGGRHAAGQAADLADAPEEFLDPILQTLMQASTRAWLPAPLCLPCLCDPLCLLLLPCSNQPRRRVAGASACRLLVAVDPAGAAQDPVLLPDSHITLDRATIERHLLSSATDPFRHARTRLQAYAARKHPMSGCPLQKGLRAWLWRIPLVLVLPTAAALPGLSSRRCAAVPPSPRISSSRTRSCDSRLRPGCSSWRRGTAGAGAPPSLVLALTLVGPAAPELAERTTASSHALFHPALLACTMHLICSHQLHTPAL